MEFLDILKRVPQEHYTEHKGSLVQVKDLIKILEGKTNKGIKKK